MIQFTYIGIGKPISPRETLAAFSKQLMPLQVHLVLELGSEILPDTVASILVRNTSALDFPVFVEILRCPGPEESTADFTSVLARRLSSALAVRTIVDGTHYFPLSGPGAALVFDEDRTFKADDYGTTFADGRPDTSVRMQEEITLNFEEAERLFKLVAQPGPTSPNSR